MGVEGERKVSWRLDELEEGRAKRRGAGGERPGVSVYDRRGGAAWMAVLLPSPLPPFRWEGDGLSQDVPVVQQRVEDCDCEAGSCGCPHDLGESLRVREGVWDAVELAANVNAHPDCSCPLTPFEEVLDGWRGR